jgi:hypothetical protein
MAAAASVYVHVMEIPRLSWSDSDDTQSEIQRALDNAGCCVVEGCRAGHSAGRDPR